MKINPQTNHPFTLAELATIATTYYDNYRSGQIKSGFKETVCTDGINTMFVPASYTPTDDEAVFMCDVRRAGNACRETSGTGCHLIKYKGQETEETEQLWREFLKWRSTPEYYKKGDTIYIYGKPVQEVRTEK